MFKAKKLNKLVAAGIITQTQKQQILEYDDNADSLALVSRALMLLGIFTVGLGIISLIASNWQDIGRTAKLATMLALLAGTGGLAWHWQSQGKRAAAEKMLLGEFFLVGAGIGLIIQVFQLSGGKIYDPLAVWCLVAAPLLFVTGQKLVSYFWVPLFLVWGIIYVCDNVVDFVWNFEVLMAVLLAAAGCGRGIAGLFPGFSAGNVLKQEALAAFYIVLAGYILIGGFDGYDGLMTLGRAAALLAVLSLLFIRFGRYALIRRNIKLGGLIVAMLYVNLGTELGLFETGIGLIASGVLLILLLKYVPRAVHLVSEEKKNA